LGSGQSIEEQQLDEQKKIADNTAKMANAPQSGVIK
jgi:hypothetical protein